jgi:hypothetical protein
MYNKAAGKLENKNSFSSKELQSQVFSDFSGLDIYDFHARQHDPQTCPDKGGISGFYSTIRTIPVYR